MILMVPVYGINSLLSLIWKEYGLYFDLVRDCYEAYVIYQFFSLLTAYIEAEKPGMLLNILSEKPVVSFPAPLCCLPRFKPSPLFFVIVKQGILQYVVVKPFMAIVSIILENTGTYHEGDFLPWHGYVYVTSITLISVFISMYFLVWFYFTTEEDLKPYSPVAKFLCIKAILFFSFWQGVFIAVLVYLSVIPDEVGHWTQKHLARGTQDFLVCIEMFLLSVVHPFVFSYDPYKEDSAVSSFKEGSPAQRAIAVPMENFAKHVINQKDVVNDLKSAYSPSALKKAKRQHQEVKKVYKEKIKKAFEIGSGSTGLPTTEHDQQDDDEDALEHISLID
uniref:Transmembrane protein 184C n=1 Tax=Arcella intermedia TaxID=1963864 RepID=A0A6B2L7G1_9EUKA